MAEPNSESNQQSSDFYCDFVLSGSITVNKVMETDNVLAYHHTKPSWTTHIVIVPKHHISKLTDLADMSLVQEVFQVARVIIKKNGLDGSNFKIITNGGRFQDSRHLHFHLLSGEKTAVKN